MPEQVSDGAGDHEVSVHEQTLEAQVYPDEQSELVQHSTGVWYPESLYQPVEHPELVQVVALQVAGRPHHASHFWSVLFTQTGPSEAWDGCGQLLFGGGCNTEPLVVRSV